MNDVQSIFYKAVTAIANEKTFAEIRVGCGVGGKMSDSTFEADFDLSKFCVSNTGSDTLR